MLALFTKNKVYLGVKETLPQKFKEYGKIYKAGGIEITYQSSLLIEEGHNLIGKTIKSIKAGSYSIIINFTDGSEFEVQGFTLEDGRPDTLNTKFTEKTVKI